MAVQDYQEAINFMTPLRSAEDDMGQAAYWMRIATV